MILRKCPEEVDSNYVVLVTVDDLLAIHDWLPSADCTRPQI